MEWLDSSFLRQRMRARAPRPRFPAFNNACWSCPRLLSGHSSYRYPEALSLSLPSYTVPRYASLLSHPATIIPPSSSVVRSTPTRIRRHSLDQPDKRPASASFTITTALATPATAPASSHLRVCRFTHIHRKHQRCRYVYFPC